MKVAVFDQPAEGAASRSAAGMLAPSIEGLPATVLPHALAARDYYPSFLSWLAERVDVRVELNRDGILELADHEGELVGLIERAHPSARIVTPRELRTLEPSLAPHAGAILHPVDGAVDNVALMSALCSAVLGERRIVLRQARVAAVGPAPSLTLDNGDVVHARRIVLAGGAWADLVGGLPRAIPVRPVRGQLLALRGRPLSHVMYAPRTGYLVPRGDHLVVGATVEQTGFVNETTAWGRQELLSIVSRTLPGVERATVVSHWAGLRPMSPDTQPILGPDPENDWLVYACGFSRNGVLLAPWAARLLAEGLAEERYPGALDSFSIRRFDGQ